MNPETEVAKQKKLDRIMREMCSAFNYENSRIKGKLSKIFGEKKLSHRFLCSFAESLVRECQKDNIQNIGLYREDKRYKNGVLIWLDTNYDVLEKYMNRVKYEWKENERNVPSA